jgi:hypothetical protein
MNPEELKINITTPGEHLIRIGQAAPEREQRQINISGNIDAVRIYLTARKDDVRHARAYIIANESLGAITLFVDENSPYYTKVYASLELHPDFVKWGINTDKQYSSTDLSQMIKMNRFMFPSTAQAMELVAIFQNLKARIQKEIEFSDDKRGNKTNLQSQIVLNMSIPETFLIHIPIFKGFEAFDIPIEISINADTLNIQLISPVANDIINSKRKAILFHELQAIELLELTQMPVINS